MKIPFAFVLCLLASACAVSEESAAREGEPVVAAVVTGVRLTSSPSGQYSLLSQSAIALGRRRCLQPTSAGAGATYLLSECTGAGAQGFRLQPMADGSYKVINRSNDRCLDVLGWSRQNGAAIGQWDCGENQDNQKFWLQASGWYYTLRNVYSDLCLDLGDTSAPEGGAVVQRICSTAASQRFAAIVTGDTPGFVQLVNRNSGLCVEAENAGLTDGINASQNTCGTNVANRMLRASSSGPLQTFRFRHSDKCLDVSGASPWAGANLQQWSCNGGVAQRYLVANVAGAFLLVNEGSGRCADIAAWSTRVGGNLQQWDCGAAQANQLFELRGSLFRDTPSRGAAAPREVLVGGGWPRFAKVNGALLLGTDGDPLELRDSFDNGSTWSGPRTLVRDPAAVKDLGNVFPLQLKNGEVLAAVRHHNPPIYRLQVFASGTSSGQGPWSLRSELEVASMANGQGEIGVWEPFLLEASDGSLHIYYAKEVPGKNPNGTTNDDQVLLMRRSFDRGFTWSAPILVASAQGRRDGMPVVTTLTDGSLLAVFESLGANATIDSVRSYDNGRTWTERTTVYSRAGYYVGAPYVTTLGNGELQVVFQEAPVNTDGQNQIRALGSLTAQATAERIGWTAARSISAAHALWPVVFFTTCVSCAGQRRALVAYERGGTKILPFDVNY